MKFLNLVIVVLIITTVNSWASFQNVHLYDQLPEIDGLDIISQDKISTQQFVRSNQIIVISYWAEWSERSVEQLKYFHELARQKIYSEIKFLTIYSGHYNSSQLQEYILKEKITLPVIVDKKSQLAHSFGLIAIPSTIITDKSGIIKSLFSGFSLTAKDKLTDSISVQLGIQVEKDSLIEQSRYRPNKKALHFYNTAFKLFSQKSYEQAVMNLEKAENYDSLYIQPYLLHATILNQTKSYDNIPLIIKKLTAIDSTLLFPNILMSKEFIRNKKYTDAIALLQKVISSDTTQIDAYFLLTECHLSLNQTEYAQNNLNIIFAHYSSNPKAIILQGILHTIGDDKKSAIDSFLKAGKIIFP